MSQFDIIFNITSNRDMSRAANGTGLCAGELQWPGPGVVEWLGFALNTSFWISISIYFNILEDSFWKHLSEIHGASVYGSFRHAQIVVGYVSCMKPRFCPVNRESQMVITLLFVNFVNISATPHSYSMAFPSQRLENSTFCPFAGAKDFCARSGAGWTWEDVLLENS